jgi:hypothetical protein
MNFDVDVNNREPLNEWISITNMSIRKYLGSIQDGVLSMLIFADYEKIYPNILGSYYNSELERNNETLDNKMLYVIAMYQAFAGFLKYTVVEEMDNINKIPEATNNPEVIFIADADIQ